MKIKEISTHQFAGSMNKSVTFSDNLNIVYGENETGKTTLVNLIKAVLFDNDKKSVKDYYPASIKNSTLKADFIDGKVEFETDKGKYVLEKEWKGTKANPLFSTPYGASKNSKDIENELKGLLGYGPGVYKEILLNNQNNSSVEAILTASKKETDTRLELANLVSQAFVQSNGVSIDEIEGKINETIEGITGKYWNVSNHTPMLNKGERYKKGTGEIYNLYFVVEDIKKLVNDKKELLNKIESTKEQYEKSCNEYEESKTEYEDFQKIQNDLKYKNNIQNDIANQQKYIEEYVSVLESWPKHIADLNKAQSLKVEYDNRLLTNKYESAVELNEKITEFTMRLNSQSWPSKDDVETVKTKGNNITAYENKLKGMNLNAMITMLNNHNIEITSVRTQEKIVVSDVVSIDEAVMIEIPGVMKMQLAPKNIDAKEIQERVNEERTSINKIFNQYGVNDLDSLKELVREKATIDGEYAKCQRELEQVLDGEKLEDVISCYNRIENTPRNLDEIRCAIREQFGNKSLEVVIGISENKIKEYREKYSDIETLEDKKEQTIKYIAKITEDFKKISDIPEKYLKVEDPMAYSDKLNKTCKYRESDKNDKYQQKVKAEADYETFIDNSSDSLEEDLENAQAKFEEKKELLNHWLHIQTVFLKLKEELDDNPMEELANRFTKYLGLLSENTLESQSANTSKIDLHLSSKNRELAYQQLSEGTKDTVSLAFRLAALEYLFPDGGGIIVFDDPFTDMDDKRNRKACQLIQECAKNHQVIFLTCKKEYLNMLDGNVINF